MIRFLLASVLLLPSLAARAAGDAPPPRRPEGRPEICTQQFAPVCGELTGARKTYGNSCFAAAAGARVVTDGACPP